MTLDSISTPFFRSSISSSLSHHSTMNTEAILDDLRSRIQCGFTCCCFFRLGEEERWEQRIGGSWLEIERGLANPDDYARVAATATRR